MTTLRDQIQALRPQNIDYKKTFIPHRSLYALLTKPVIYQAVSRQSSIHASLWDNIVARVLNGGRRVFAILVLLKNEEFNIVHFLAKDDYRPLDSQLPFDKATLEAIAPSIAQDFYNTQWQLTAPTFSRNILHRKLNDNTVLPFLLDDKKGEGGGIGDIFEIQFHPEHQLLPDFPPDAKFVRKEFRNAHEDDRIHEAELHCLSVLNDIRHPNVVELVSSYTINGYHNLIFPLASDGDLSQLLSSERRPPSFSKDERFSIALANFSSALELVHDFVSEKLGLHLIGCHHDLSPRNILVHDDKFILADFGLSTFKPNTESSKCLFAVGGGHYLAPECEDYEDNFKHKIISRPSDIWSFGCIIAEVMTFMALGNFGVSDFKRRRKHTVRTLTTYTFHTGVGKGHPEVEKWFDDMQKTLISRADLALLGLVKSMLSLNPSCRPLAPQVTRRLRAIAAMALIDSIHAMSAELRALTQLFEAEVEHVRFHAWCLVVMSIVDNQASTGETMKSFSISPDVLVGLEDYAIKLESIRKSYNNALSPLFSGLRRANDRLEALISPDLRSQARTRVELHFVQTEDLKDLQETTQHARQHDVQAHIGLLATIKRMTILARQKQENGTMPAFDRGCLESMKPFGDHHVAILAPKGQESKQILIEWIGYDTYWEGPVSDEMVARVQAISELFGAHEMASVFGVFRCSSFFHEPDRTSFGLVYELPPDEDAPSSCLRSLIDVLNDTKNVRERPALGDRFNLARKIAKWILELHKVGWLHESLSSFNIAFIHHGRLDHKDWIVKPHLVGFNHCRPDMPKAFTQGPALGSKYQEYQHPSYAGRKQRYRPEFDYYSLGIVLLEIGLWQPLAQLRSGWKTSSRKTLQDLLLEKRVPLLAHSMGKGYQEAVLSCLDKHGGFGAPLASEWNPEDRVTVHLTFESKVVEPLARCSA